jgi:hypothetical protein
MKVKFDQQGKGEQWKGSIGNLPVPVGNLPTGTGGADINQSGAGLLINDFFHSAGLVAQRHGQVARATQKDGIHGLWSFIFFWHSTKNSEEPNPSLSDWLSRRTFLP